MGVVLQSAAAYDWSSVMLALVYFLALIGWPIVVKEESKVPDRN